MRDQREYVLEFGKNFGILCGLKLCVTQGALSLKLLTDVALYYWWRNRAALRHLRTECFLPSVYRYTPKATRDT